MYYTIPSDNWEQQHGEKSFNGDLHYTIPSDNWEQQLLPPAYMRSDYYTIPSDNWEQQQSAFNSNLTSIIPYQAIIRKLDYA